MYKKVPKLSASRIKTLENCSWSYWCNYHLKIPQKKNEGAIRGTICHLIFELLLARDKNGKFKRKKMFDAMLEKGGVESCPPVRRLLVKHLKKEEAYTEENYDMCKEMIVVCLKNDFYAAGGKIGEPELEFLLEKENPTYKVMGFMDKPVLYKNKVKIIDYKTSKYKFRGEELTSNVQAMVYTLAAKDIWPDAEDVMIEFQFLRFPRQPLQQIVTTKEQLRGFEYYLEHVYKVIMSFDISSAKSNYAADKDDCKWLCKAGKTWRCPYLDPLEYYSLVNKDDQIVKSSFKEEDLKPKSGEKIVKKKYEGCPAHRHIKQSAQTKGVVDDFDF